MTSDSERERVQIESAEELLAWLDAHHRQQESIWLVTWKKSSGKSSVSYDDIVDICLCYGWIDSAVRKLDDERSMLRLSPRRLQSNWSASNKRRIERLAAAGRLKPPGKRAVAHARESGTWTFLDDVEKLIIPEDLLQALKGEGDALRLFGRFPDSSTRRILEWIESAKTPKTRDRRIRETASMAARNRKAGFPAGQDAGPALFD